MSPIWKIDFISWRFSEQETRIYTWFVGTLTRFHDPTDDVCGFFFGNFCKLALATLLTQGYQYAVKVVIGNFIAFNILVRSLSTAFYYCYWIFFYKNRTILRQHFCADILPVICFGAEFFGCQFRISVWFLHYTEKLPQATYTQCN